MPVWMIADVFLMNSSKLKKLGQGLTYYVYSDEHAHIMCAFKIPLSVTPTLF